MFGNAVTYFFCLARAEKATLHVDFTRQLFAVGFPRAPAKAQNPHKGTLRAAGLLLPAVSTRRVRRAAQGPENPLRGLSGASKNPVLYIRLEHRPRGPRPQYEPARARSPPRRRPAPVRRWCRLPPLPPVVPCSARGPTERLRAGQRRRCYLPHGPKPGSALFKQNTVRSFGRARRRCRFSRCLIRPPTWLWADRVARAPSRAQRHG